MSTARKTHDVRKEEWVPLGRAVGLLGVKSSYTVLVLALRGELVARPEEVGSRVFISRESIDRYLEKQSIDARQLSVAL